MPPDHDKKEFPVGSDAVELVVRGDKVYLYCLYCEKTVGEDVSYLNETILVWNQHVEELDAAMTQEK